MGWTMLPVLLWLNGLSVRQHVMAFPSALKQWQFDPAVKQGKSVDVVVNVEINFNLRK
jgi:hypothetical protein